VGGGQLGCVRVSCSDLQCASVSPVTRRALPSNKEATAWQHPNIAAWGPDDFRIRWPARQQARVALHQSRRMSECNVYSADRLCC